MTNNNTKKGWASPAKITVMVLCAVLLIALGALAAMKVMASMGTEKGIGTEKAAQIALQDAGYEESQVSNLNVHYDGDDLSSSYEVTFIADSFKYEYDIAASNGKITGIDKEALYGQSSPAADNPGSSATGEGGQNAGSDNYIGEEKAKELALQTAGIDAAAATFTKVKLDRDDGIYVYEIEFISGDFEYSFEINATTGAIVEKNTESIYD